MDTTLHVFEAAGLGLAPFRVIGAVERRGPIRIDNRDGTVTEIGAPGQPMGTCKYCGQGIAICFEIRSSDGKVFDVGSDCVAKTGDAGLKRTAAPHVRKLRHAQQDARIEAARELVKRPDVREALGAQPHPTPWAAERGRTLLDWAEWMLSHGGRAGKVRGARVIEKAVRS